MKEPLASFIDRLEGLVHQSMRETDLVTRIADSLRPLVTDGGWLPKNVSVPVSGKPYSQYLLHLSPDSAWSVVSFVWPAGSSTPVHDHGCWGVVGVLQGEETETGFRVKEGDREAGPVKLVGGATRVMRPGDVTSIVPPDDVHQVSNQGTGTAISIHVYGSDIGVQHRHSFDPATGKVRSFVSGYDQPIG